MKYYNLPSAEQIACYHNGTLSVQDKQWIEAVMQKNPFVKEAVKTFPTAQIQTVQQISERVGTRIKNQYLTPRGFWSKYGVWIGLSSIAIVLAGGYFLTNNAEQRYFQDGNKQHISAITIDQESDVSEQNLVDEKGLNTLQNENTTLVSEKENTLLTEEENRTDKTIETVSEFQSTEQMSSDHEQTETKEEKEGINLSGKLLKSIRGISIIHIDKGGLKRKDIPEFPGGNIGLTNHFQSYITPVELQYGEKLYDAKSEISLEIGANGKLKNHEIQGNLHELHTKQIRTAIEKLPQFKPGKGDATFTLEVKFN